ncbi:MAG: response regulator [Anaerolineales bacterium]
MPDPLVLIVDDDPGARETLEALLHREPVQLLFAENGHQALELVQQHDPDVILLDVMMPGMDGFAVCAAVRANPQSATTPILLITALDDRAARLRGLDAGADDFLTKPVDRAELRARLRTILKLNRYRTLLGEREKFIWVVEQAQEGYLMLNPTGQVLYANQTARQWLLIDDEPQQSFLACATQHYQLQPNGNWGHWREGKISEEPLYLVRPETPHSDAFWCLVEAQPMQHQDGWLVRLRDVSQQMVSRRVTWSFETQVSHKLRTPLTVLIAAFQLLDENIRTRLSPEHQKMLDMAQRGLQRLETEIQNILSYTETAARLHVLEGENCSLQQAIHSSQNLAKQFNLPPIEWQIDPILSAHELRLPLALSLFETILHELLTNAKKFHPRGAPHVQIVATLEQTARAFIRLEVQDDGVHLSPVQLDKIFLPYYQAERRFSGQRVGSGLGLAMVAAILWGIGGGCYAHNRIGQAGLVIGLEFPLLPDATDGAP